jgi:hypothetical protein
MLISIGFGRLRNKLKYLIYECSWVTLVLMIPLRERVRKIGEKRDIRNLHSDGLPKLKEER